MRKVLTAIFVSFLFFLTLSFSPKAAYATVCPQLLTVDQPTLAADFNSTITISTSENCFSTAVEYIVSIHPQSQDGNTALWSNFAISRTTPSDEKTIQINVNLFAGSKGKQNPGTWIVKICSPGEISKCGLDPTNLSSTLVGIASVTVSPFSITPPPPRADQPKIFPLPLQCVYQVGSPLKVIVDNAIPGKKYLWWWYGDTPGANFTPSSTTTSFSIDIPSTDTTKAGVRVLCVEVDYPFVIPGCSPGAQNTILFTFTTAPPTGDKSCKPYVPPTPIPPFNPTKCDAADTACNTCVGADPAKPQGIPTAVGCIPTNLAGFVGRIFGIILGLAGGVALLLIIYSGYRMATEGSNPESLQGARETLTSAIVGLLFIIFSFVILEVIGVDILRLPQFGRETVNTPGGEVVKDCFDVRYAIKNIKECGNDTLTLACRGLRNDIEDIYDRNQTPTNQQLDLEKQCKDKGF